MRSEVAAHVAWCAHCGAKLDRIRTIDQLVGSLPHTSPSAGVFERTLAAAHDSTIDPRAVTRERLPGARSADLRRRLREVIAPDIEQGTSAGDGARRVQPNRRGRAAWVAAAIPVVAALLLISLAMTLFNRFPSFPQQGATSHPTPQTSDPLKQTQSVVDALAGQLAFTPVVPTYLPEGARAPSATIGPAEPVQANSRYLDITWEFSSGPAQSLHLRELPNGLGYNGYTPASGANTSSLTWSLPQSQGWRPLTATACQSCLAVGETRSAMQLVLDAQPRGSASVAALAVWLRLVSLSLDLPYRPISVNLAAPDSALALRYQATVADGQGRQWNWDVTIVGSNGSQQYARAVGGGVDVVQIVNGGAGARLDNASHTYQSLPPPFPSAQPPRSVTQPLYAAGGFVATGELWNLGVGQVKLPDGRTLSVYDLYRVNGAQPEHIYADATTGQTLALVVTTPSSERPGGSGGSQTFVSTSACQPYTVTYTTIEYVPEKEISPTLFDTQQPAGWGQGTVTPAFTCQG
jgi:hypothetical protein